MPLTLERYGELADKFNKAVEENLIGSPVKTPDKKTSAYLLTPDLLKSSGAKLNSEKRVVDINGFNYHVLETYTNEEGVHVLYATNPVMIRMDDKAMSKILGLSEQETFEFMGEMQKKGTLEWLVDISGP